MEFCLIYNGVLPSSNKKKNIIEIKHQIRSDLHPQLMNLWKQEPLKTDYREEESSQIIEIGKYKFLPLITNKFNMYADLKIDFFRFGNPGDITNGGDIDNRIKILFDGLRRPRDISEIPNSEKFKEINSNTIYCLLDDDNLIANLRINTYKNLMNNEKNHVLLIIKIKIKLSFLTLDNIGFSS